MRTESRWGRKHDAYIPSERSPDFLALRFCGFRDHAADDIARNDSLWVVLFCAVCGRGNRGGLADVLYSPLKRVFIALPDHGVEAVAFHKIRSQIERDGTLIG